MRATPRTLATKIRAVFRRTPLRLKLVATVLVLVIIALTGSGLAARATMDDYLIGRLDAGLTAAADPIAGHSEHTGNHTNPNGARSDRLPSAYVVEELDASGAVVSGPTSNLVNPGEPLPRFPRPTGQQTKAAGTRRFTVAAVHRDGHWRVLAEPIMLADGSTGTLLVAQSMRDIGDTLDRLTELLLIIGASAIVIIGGVGYIVVRASLRPLHVVEQTAAQIAAGELTHRVPEADPRTEVGQLSGALNTMLSRIEIAFAERAASEQAALSSEKRMRISEAAARRSEERMRSFVADASHELRTPLTTIRGFAELYRQGAVSDDDGVRRVMGRIEGEATRMGLLVEDLLLLARLDHERPLARDRVDLLALASDAVHDAQTVAPDRAVSLDVGSTDPPPIVVGDDARLRQVLGNLLSNALKYTPPATPITVSVRTGRRHGSSAFTATITVTDAGPGLDPQSASRIFERFYRVDDARNRNDGGTGLGLAIVAALITGHGGTVDVRSAPGKGASFIVDLPLADTATC
jgi:two-component system OmpR family sensor kinase